MNERVSISIENGIANVRMNRPEKHNALDAEQMTALLNAGEHLKENADVRVVVLSGNGPSFCSGLDASMFSSGLGAGGIFAKEEGMPCNRVQLLAYQWSLLPMPVIGALHGYVFGGGLQIALGTDIRYVHPEAQLSLMEIKWGLIPDMSASQTLRHLVALDVAKELAFTGRKVAGVEAQRLGLATHVSEDPLADALALAAEIASKSPDAVRAAKHVMQDGRYGSAEEGFEREARAQTKLIGSPNQMEAIMANMEKRVPQFAD